MEDAPPVRDNDEQLGEGGGAGPPPLLVEQRRGQRQQGHHRGLLLIKPELVLYLVAGGLGPLDGQRVDHFSRVTKSKHRTHDNCTEVGKKLDKHGGVADTQQYIRI